MSLGWYRQPDGVTHRLHYPTGWSDLYLTAGMTRTEPLLSVDAGDLRRGMEFVLNAVDEAASDDFSAIEVHVGTNELYLTAGNQKHLRGVVLPSSTTSAHEGSFLIDAKDSALAGLTGAVKVRLGATRDWASTVIFDGVEQDVAMPARRGITTSRWVWANPNATSIVVDWGEVMVARHGIENLDSVILAFAPDRLIVRSSEGMVKTMLGTLDGTPVQSTLPRLALTKAVDSMPADVSRTRISSWGQTPAFHFSSTNTATYWLFTNSTPS